jgi:hypothetical protein
MSYRSMEEGQETDRRTALKGIGACTALAGGALLGLPPAYGEEDKKATEPVAPPAVETNIGDFMKVPKAKGAIPGPCPGRVVEVKDDTALKDDKIDGAVVGRMLEEGITKLTGKSMKESFELLFKPEDVVGLKVNPVGPPLINTHRELTEAVIRWLVDSGLPKKNIIIWDRFEGMLHRAGYTQEDFPGIGIEALQIIDEEGNAWKDGQGRHVSEDRFDREAFYYAKGVLGKGVRGYKDDEFYLNQHVFNGEYSYFGNLVTKKLTKIVNLAAFKNTGAGISMALKNLGYAAICNTGRLHQPLFFRVCTEVTAAPWVRDKLALNITDALRGQYDGGPALNSQFVYDKRTLFFATDPFALDMTCHLDLMQKRKAEKVQVSGDPRYTDYLHQGERLGLGIANPEKIEHIRVGV